MTTLSIPTYLAIAGLCLSLAALVFAWFRWYRDRVLHRQLVSIQVATTLESMARHYLLVVKDDGVWSLPGHPQDMENMNEVSIALHDVPDFTEIDHLEKIDRGILNKLLSLQQLDFAIRRFVNGLHYGDEPDFGYFFKHRQIFYAGFGIYVAMLAIDLRKSIYSRNIGALASDTLENLRNEMRDKLVLLSSPLPEMKSAYEKYFLPVNEAYWPNETDIKNRKVAKAAHTLAQRKRRKRKGS